MYCTCIHYLCTVVNYCPSNACRGEDAVLSVIGDASTKVAVFGVDGVHPFRGMGPHGPYGPHY